MFCPKCGAELNGDEMFCRKCGTALQHEDTALQNTTPIPDISKGIRGKKEHHRESGNHEHHERVIKKLSIKEIRGETPLTDVSGKHVVQAKADEATTLLSETEVETIEEALSQERQGIKEYDYSAVKREAFRGGEKYETEGFEDAFEDDEDLLDADDEYFDDEDMDDDVDINDEDIDDGDEEERRPKMRRSSLVKIIAAGVLVILAICAVAGMFLFSWYRNSKLEAFKMQCDTFVGAMRDNNADYGIYREIYDQAEAAINARDFSAIDDLSRQLDKLLTQMKDEAGDLQTLADLKVKYEALFAKYQITEDYQETYDTLMQRLDQAISERQESEVGAIRNELESLHINLTTSNQQLIQSKLNDINKLDLAKASTDEKALMTSYQEQKDAAVSEENYADALRVIDLWYADAEKIANNIRESESREKELRESESRAKESEEAARQSEEAARQSEALANGDYLLPGSESRAVTADEVNALTPEQRRLARNEIYARHGRRFKDADVQAYFDAQSWYSGTVSPESFDEGVLNAVEKANIALIKSLE